MGLLNRYNKIKGVSVHFLEKWRHFVSPQTLLCFRARVWIKVRVRFRIRVADGVRGRP